MALEIVLRSRAGATLAEAQDNLWFQHNLYEPKALKLMNDSTRLLLRAAARVVAEAGLDCSQASARRGIYLLMTLPFADEELRALAGKGTNQIQHLQQNLAPLWLLKQLPNLPAAHLALQFKFQGPAWTGQARREDWTDLCRQAEEILSDGEVDLLLVGICSGREAEIGLLEAR
ncbi:MAG: hypothetical protein HC904_16180 [Blastochloris sp.]|nr:hypothetical protein [Blastochloris sp.]